MLKISPKQNSVVDCIVNDKKEIILLTGVIGSSKTFTAATVAISMAKQYSNSVIGVGKKNRTEITTGTMYSFENAADEMGVTYQQNLQLLNWMFDNGSRIQFYELDITKDRDFNKPKKMELTANIIDEVDSVAEAGFWAAHGRVGRVNNCVHCNATPKEIEDGKKCSKEAHRQPPAFSLLTCNPNETWVKDTFYDKKRNGTLPDEMELVEFGQDDSFLGKAYYDKYKNAPIQFVKRYLENDWSYGDDDSSLFKYRHLDKVHTHEVKRGTKYIGLDVARSGSDRSVLSLWHDHQLVDIKIIKDKDEVIDTADQAEMLKEYAEKEVVGYEHIAVDAIGVGVGVVDYLRKTYDWHVTEYIAGAKGSDGYKNYRSETIHALARDIESEVVSFYESCPFLSEFKKEATQHNYETKEKQLVVEPKDKIKERLGASPDIFDSVVISYSFMARPTADVGLISTGEEYSNIFAQFDDTL